MKRLIRSDQSARVSTGIEGLDRLTGGGFIEGKSYLVTGAPGAGKSVLALQFARSGLLSGARCVYITVNERPDGLLSNALTLGWDFQSALADKELVFLDASPYFADPVRRVGGQYVRKLVADLAKHVKRNDAHRLIVDGIGPLLPDADEVTAGAREFIYSAEDYLGCTTLVTLDDRVSRPHPLESYVAGIVDLIVTSKDQKALRMLRVRKMRATAADISAHRFEVLPMRGIGMIGADGSNGEGVSDARARSVT